MRTAMTIEAKTIIIQGQVVVPAMDSDIVTF